MGISKSDFLGIRFFVATLFFRRSICFNGRPESTRLLSDSGFESKAGCTGYGVRGTGYRVRSGTKYGTGYGIRRRQDMRGARQKMFHIEK